MAARALANDVPFDSADDLARWAFTVARNLARDDVRSQRRLVGSSVEDRPAPDEVSALVEKRMVLEAVTQAFDQLTDSERRAILSGITPVTAGSRKEDVRLAVRRYRARTHLTRLLKGLVGILGGAWAGRRLVSGGSTAGRLVGAAYPAALVVTMSVSILALRSDPPVPPERGPDAPPEELIGRSQPTTTSSPRLAVHTPSESKPPPVQVHSAVSRHQPPVPNLSGGVPALV